MLSKQLGPPLKAGTESTLVNGDNLMLLLRGIGHLCVLFREVWHCSPMAEFSGFVAELHKVRAEPHSATPGLLPGGPSLGRNECRSR